LNSASPVVSLKEISKSFSGVCVLHDISMDIWPGEVHCLVGENGAGKSTLIKIISGAYRADHGTIIYQGQTITHHTPKWARENGITTIYQEIDMVPALNAVENIFLGSEILKPGGNIDRSAACDRAKKILNDLGVDINVDIPVGRLKVANQQMVAIAKALNLNSRVIILDEPTAVFTTSEVELLFRIIQQLKSQGIAIIYISHHLDEIFRIGDRITVLRDGFLVRTGAISGFDKNSLVRAMVGREIDLSKRNGSKAIDREVLCVKGLTRYGAVEDVSFTLHEGEIVGVAGLVGAGRTEMARLIVGADPMDRGEVYLRGERIKIKSPQNALSMGMGMVPENRKTEGVVPVRSMSENIAYSTVEIESRYGIVSWKEIKAKVRNIIKELEVRPAKPNVQVCYLSGGNQQKVVLGKWLAAKCDLLILDEPTRGVDVGARTEIYKLMQQLKKEGKSILMISSDLTEILTQSDRILVMARGRITGELSFKEATEERVLSLALQLGGAE